MAIFTALLSVQNGVSIQAVLGREADRLRVAGDPRTRAQLMADLLVRWGTQPFVAHQPAEAGADGGPTAAHNAQGLWVGCNHAKQVRGWIARVRHGPPDRPEAHTIQTVTPTGHTYTSTASRLEVRQRPRTELRFPLELAV